MDANLNDEIAKLNYLIQLTNEGVTKEQLANITGRLAYIANELKPVMTQRQYHNLTEVFKNLRKPHALRPTFPECCFGTLLSGKRLKGM